MPSLGPGDELTSGHRGCAKEELITLPRALLCTYRVRSGSLFREKGPFFSTDPIAADSPHLLHPLVALWISQTRAIRPNPAKLVHRDRVRGLVTLEKERGAWEGDRCRQSDKTCRLRRFWQEALLPAWGLQGRSWTVGGEEECGLPACLPPACLGSFSCQPSVLTRDSF